MRLAPAAGLAVGPEARAPAESGRQRQRLARKFRLAAAGASTSSSSSMPTENSDIDDRVDHQRCRALAASSQLARPVDARLDRGRQDRPEHSCRRAWSSVAIPGQPTSCSLSAVDAVWVAGSVSTPIAAVLRKRPAASVLSLVAGRSSTRSSACRLRSRRCTSLFGSMSDELAHVAWEWSPVLLR